MKRIALIAALALVSTAHAGTLSQKLCGWASIFKCTDVPNSDGPLVDLLQYDWVNKRVYVTVGTARYDSGANNPTLANLPFSFTGLVLTDANGNQILLSATFRTWSTTSGRTRLMHYELVTGSITP